MPIRQTHTYAELDVSALTYYEIAKKLRAAEYHHAFVDGALDMHGIGLTTSEPEISDSMWRDRMRALIKKHGGGFHGPRVEHLSMEEQAFWRFLREVTGRPQK